MLKLKNSGFTLVEVMVTTGVSVLLLTGFLGSVTVSKSLNALSRHQMQALQVVKSQMELLKATAFSNIADSSAANTTYDAGVDGTFGTADDLTGTLTVTRGDFLDMDADGNTAETAIDINGDGTNDTAYAVPVRVAFTWTQNIIGTSKSFTVSADTLLSA